MLPESLSHGDGLHKIHETRSAMCLVNNIFFSFSENRKVLEEERYVFNPGSTETVNCSIEETDFGQKFSWYNYTGSEIKSGGRIKLNGLHLEIKSVQLDDAGKYKCQGTSNSRIYTIVVACKFPICLSCTLSQDYFRYILPPLQYRRIPKITDPGK